MRKPAATALDRSDRLEAARPSRLKTCTESPSGGAIYVATANEGKIRELQPLFAQLGFEIVRYHDYVSPPEGDWSYTDNAALKARALHDVLRAAGCTTGVLADDSGLEVAALGGKPGVATADYGGREASWPIRREKLLGELAKTGSLNRRARFVCAMHYIDRDGREFASLGTVDGVIAAHERGLLGFSFDPIFLYPPAQKTFAELTDEEKNRVSHRAIATAAIVAAITAAAVRLPETAPAVRGTGAADREYGP